MRGVCALISLLVLLAACGPVPSFYREGVSVSRLASDQTACAVSALRDAPVANEIRQNPPIFFPGSRICNTSGQCYTRPGYWVDGGIYTVDVNRSLRSRVLNACMAAKGYGVVDLPRCTQNVSRPTSGRVPPLTSASCVIVGRDGINQIVTPGLSSASQE